MPKSHFIPKAPKEVEEIITHKGPKEYHLSKGEQDKRTMRIRAYNVKVRAKWLLIGGLLACTVIGLLSFFEV